MRKNCDIFAYKSKEKATLKKGIQEIMLLTSGMAIGAAIVGNLTSNIVRHKQLLSDKHLALFLMANQWIRIKQKKKSIAEYLQKKGYHQVAIYGMSYMGKTLVDELADSGIKVLYGIDKNAREINAEIEIYTPDQSLPNVDAVIITPIYFFNEIREALLGKVEGSVISLEDILYDI